MPRYLILSLLLASCAGQVESDPPDPSRCVVPFERDGKAILCEFSCVDCTGAQSGPGSCDNALPTAIDHCLYQWSRTP